MDYKSLRTSSLINKCVESDGLAWAEFIKRFSPLIALSIKRAILKYSNDKNTIEEIKDIQQNILTALWSKDKLEEIRQRENINYWIAIISRNATINYLKTRRKEVLIVDNTYFEKLPIKGKEIGEAERGNLNKKIEQIYNLLTPREKIIFNLYFKKEQSLKDISKIMGIPVGTVSSIVTRMRQKIKCSKI